MAAKFTQKPDHSLHHSGAARCLSSIPHSSLPSTSASSSSSSSSFKALFRVSDLNKKRNPFLLYSSQDKRGSSGTWRLILQSWTHFGAISEKWRFVQFLGWLPKGVQQCSSSTNQFLVHVVKQGETLTSISRHYGVPLHAITAVNSNIIDVNLVFEGQHLNIPLNARETQRDSVKEKLPEQIDVQTRWQSTLNISQAHENYVVFTKLPAHYLHIAKPTGYFLVLVPFIAFCIRCIACAFHHRVAQELKPQAVNESETTHRGSGSMRWKSILSDIGEPDAADAESRKNSVSSTEDESQVPFEEISHAYTNLEPAYMKFLSESGMSKWGHWRGGSPD